MSTIVTRSGKGSPLTNTEVDANFTNLNTGKAELSGAVFTGAITTNSTIDGRDVAADGVTADAALPKAGGAMTGAITTNSTFDGVDIATRDAVLTSTTTTANAALPKAGGTLTGTLQGTRVGIGVAAHSSAALNITTTDQHIRFNNGSELGIIDLDSDGELNIWAHGDGEVINLRTGSGAGSDIVKISPTGIDVTGTATMDGLTVDLADNAGVLIQSPNDSSTAFLKFGDATSVDSGSISYDHFSDALRFKTINTTRMILANNGDISFYEDTGTTAKFFWDASAESLGIGTNLPARILEVSSGTAALFRISATDTSPGYAATEFRTNGSAYAYVGTEGGTGGQLFVGTTAFATVLGNTTALPIQFATNNNVRATIDSSGNVGIGTSSPAYSLDVSTSNVLTSRIQSSAGETILELDNTATNGRRYMIISGGNSGSLSGGKFGVFDATAGATRLAIDSSGNVGIGRTPTAVESAYDSIQLGAGGMYLAGSSNLAAGQIGQNFYADTSGNIKYLGNDEAERITFNNGIITFDNASANASGAGAALTFNERMRIDASGNVLVGVTSTTIPGIGNTTAGVSIRGDDGSFFSRALGSGDANNVVSVNRTTADGNILGFQKDGTTVGSIGNNTDFYIASQDGTGVRFSATQVLPCSESGATQNGSRDLGASNARFKDLYLSGGVYLGGTGAANKLDDYEEGTWTPTIRTGNNDNWTSTFTENSYTKIGSLVTISLAGTMTATGTTAQSNLYAATALPFAPRSFSPLLGYGSTVDGGESSMTCVNSSLSYPISKLTTVVPAKTVGQTSDFKIFLQYHTNT